MLCCSCGLCTLYACPESLFPKEACDKGKRDLKEAGIAWSGKKEVEIHPMYEGRRTPLKQLIKRLGVEEYNIASEYCTDERQAKRVEIPMKQSIGTAAQPVVRSGDRVKKGDCIGKVPEGKLGAYVHASISGKVGAIGETIVIEA